MPKARSEHPYDAVLPPLAPPHHRNRTTRRHSPNGLPFRHPRQAALTSSLSAGESLNPLCPSSSDLLGIPHGAVPHGA